MRGGAFLVGKKEGSVQTIGGRRLAQPKKKCREEASETTLGPKGERHHTGGGFLSSVLGNIFSTP